MIEKKQGGHAGKMPLAVGMNRFDDLFTSGGAESEVHPSQGTFHGVSESAAAR